MQSDRPLTPATYLPSPSPRSQIRRKLRFSCGCCCQICAPHARRATSSDGSRPACALGAHTGPIVLAVGGGALPPLMRRSICSLATSFVAGARHLGAPACSPCSPCCAPTRIVDSCVSPSHNLELSRSHLASPLAARSHWLLPPFPSMVQSCCTDPTAAPSGASLPGAAAAHIVAQALTYNRQQLLIP